MNKTIKSEKLLKDFFKIVSTEYDIDFKQLKEICYGPWEDFKRTMETGEMKEVRFMYFGKFKVTEGCAIKNLRILEKKFKEDLIEPSEYFRLKELLERVIENETKAKNKRSS